MQRRPTTPPKLSLAFLAYLRRRIATRRVRRTLDRCPLVLEFNPMSKIFPVPATEPLTFRSAPRFKHNSQGERHDKACGDCIGTDIGLRRSPSSSGTSHAGCFKDHV